MSQRSRRRHYAVATPFSLAPLDIFAAIDIDAMLPAFMPAVDTLYLPLFCRYMRLPAMLICMLMLRFFAAA